MCADWCGVPDVKIRVCNDNGCAEAQVDPARVAVCSSLDYLADWVAGEFESRGVLLEPFDRQRIREQLEAERRRLAYDQSPDAV